MTHVLVLGFRETQFLRAKEEEEEENALWLIELGFVRASTAIVTLVGVVVLGLMVKNWSLGF